MKPHCLSTRFMVPAWWERAFEASITASDNDDPITIGFASGISPALHIQDLDALSILLSTLQAQILNGETLHLNPAEHRKYVSSNSRSRIFSFESVLQGLSALKVLLKSQDGSGYDAVPFFTRESWRALEDSEEGLELVLETTSLGEELVLGYGEPYSDIPRRLSGQALGDLLGQGAPLALFQSTWLDLTGIEQALLLRLERAMQWEFRWLRLDGLFGLQLRELFAGLNIPRPRRQQSSPMQLQLKNLERLGKKLVDHGMLTFENDEDYLAISKADTKGPLLVWQVAKDRIFPEEVKEYLQLVCQFLLNKVFDKNLDEVIRLIAGNLYDSSLVKQTREAFEALGDVDAEPCLHRLQDNMPVMTLPLFLEWTIRQLPGHQCPLPEPVRESAAAYLTAPTDDTPMQERFSKFVEVVKDVPDYKNDLEQLVGASFASLKTLQDKSYWRFLNNSRRSGAYTLQKAESPSTTVASPRSKTDSQLVAGKLSGNMKKVAMDELKKLRDKQPSQYNKLKQAYLDTLDETSKKIILEVQTRLQPAAFDEQLQNSLVKFMIENPSLWKSAPAENRA